MIFSEKSIEGLLRGHKVMTRRLVKEGEEFEYKIIDTKINSSKIIRVLTPKWKTKWQVGKSYAVQSKRGGKGLWYCPKCNSIPHPTGVVGITKLIVTCEECNCPQDNINIRSNWKPLRVVVKSIRKERLLDISEEDAKREGYESKNDFILTFKKINNIKYPKIKDLHIGMMPDPYNPFVWVLEFGVKK